MTDDEFLVDRGWKKIGTQRNAAYGLFECWVPPANSKAAEDPRAYWTKGSAMAWQKEWERVK